MKTLQRGDQGDQVKDLQRELNLFQGNLTVDGDFGPGTERSVMRFQKAKGLYADGVVGSRTWARLKRMDEPAETAPAPGPPSSDGFKGRTKLKGFDKVLRPGSKPHGYSQATLRTDAAASMARIIDLVHARGGQLSSAGGKRNLGVGGANRAFLSFHKTGLALDFATYSAMVSPDKDPMICVVEPLGHRILFRLYVRVTDANVPTSVHQAAVWRSGKIQTVETTGRFFDLTAVLDEHGWTRIPKRGKSRGGLEFWHVQWTKNLTLGGTSYGELLKAFWPMSELRKSKEWTHYRNRTFTGFGF